MAKQGQMRLRAALQHHNMVEPPPVRGSHIKFLVAENKYNLVRLRAKGLKPITQAEVAASTVRANTDRPKIFSELVECMRRIEQHVEVTRISVNEIYQIKQTRFLQGR